MVIMILAKEHHPAYALINDFPEICDVCHTWTSESETLDPFATRSELSLWKRPPKVSQACLYS